jgi:hypothetical protein
MNKNLYIWGIVFLGIAFLVGGLFTLWQGWHTRNELVEALADERLEVQDPMILLTYEGARAPEGVEVPTVLIDTAMEADAQARVIRTHTLSSTDGKTYSQMDREDPGRALYITSLTLQNSLHQAHIGLEISRLVLGIGLAFTGLGLGILVLWLPVVRKVVALK